MPTCVSETSYYLIFVVALLISVVLIFSAAYSYTQFKNNPNPKTSTAQSASLAFMVFGLLSAMTLFILFFGFQARFVGVFTSVNVPNTAQVMSPQ